MADEPTMGLFQEEARYLITGLQPTVGAFPAGAAVTSTDLGAYPTAPARPARPVGSRPPQPLDVRTLLHPTEHSRLLIALSSSALVFGVVVMATEQALGWIQLAIYCGALVGAVGSFWLSLQIRRSRLLGSAVRVSDSTLPELQSVVDEVRARLDYQRRIDVYVMDKVSGGSAMTSYLGTRLVRIEGDLVADLLAEHRAELVYLIGRHVGQLKARHERLQLVVIALSLFNSLRFLQLFLAPYYRATVKSGDQIGAACCGDIRASAATMNRLLVGNELGPQVAVKGVLDQAAAVRRRWLPRLLQLFQNEPHPTNRYLNLLTFFARIAPDEVRTWRASLDETTARRVNSVVKAAASVRMPRRSRAMTATLLTSIVTAGLLTGTGLVIFGSQGSATTPGNVPASGQHSTGVSTGQHASGGQNPQNAAQTTQPSDAITATLMTYIQAINAQNYPLAYSELSAADQAANPYSQFAAGDSTTTITGFMVNSVSPGSTPGTYVAFVTFQSTQAPSEAPNHTDTCDIWTLDYTMIPTSAGWLINSASPHPGGPAYTSCG